MSSTRDIRMLVRYNAWANSRLFDVLETLSLAELTMPRAPGLAGMLSVLGTMAHCYVVDLIWKGHLEARSHGFTSRIPVGLPALHMLRRDQAEVDRWYVAYADALGSAQCAEVLDFDFVDGGSGQLSRGDMLLHVVNHKTYHRGYVATMLYQAGTQPPVMDMPVFMQSAELLPA